MGDCVGAGSVVWDFLDLGLVVGLGDMVVLVRVALASRFWPGDEYEHLV